MDYSISSVNDSTGVRDYQFWISLTDAVDCLTHNFYLTFDNTPAHDIIFE